MPNKEKEKQLLYSKYIKMCISRAICTKRNRVVLKNSRMFSSSFVGLVHVSNGAVVMAREHIEFLGTKSQLTKNNSIKY